MKNGCAGYTELHGLKPRRMAWRFVVGCWAMVADYIYSGTAHNAYMNILGRYE